MDDFDLFDFEYDCDDPNWKAELEQYIKDYFYFEEIGQETIDRFKHVFKTKFKAMMGHYNRLYNTTLTGADPFTTQRLVETFESVNNAVNTQTLKNSDYPQTQDPATDIISNQQNMDNTSNGSQDYERVIEGYTGVAYPELLKMHRETLLRINSMIVKELKSCFILVY